jgi:hypothetical protein
MARPSKLTEEVVTNITNALKLGNFRQTACKAAGIGYRTFREWMAFGKRFPKGKFGRFRRAVLEAETRAEMRAVGLIMQKAAEDPKHAQWWLSHRWPKNWADKTRARLEHTGKNGGPIEVIDARNKLIDRLSGLFGTTGEDAGEPEDGPSQTQ